MSAAELADWQAYYEMAPFGPETEWYRTGVVAAEVRNMLRGPKARPVKPSDYMPKMRPAAPRDPKVEAKTVEAMFLSGFAGRVVDKRPARKKREGDGG